MMNKIYVTIRAFLLAVLSAVMVLNFAACKKTDVVLPGDNTDVAYNFYIASDIMSTAYGPTQSAVATYVDKYQEQERPISAGTGNAFPSFAFGFRGGQEYPQTNSGGNDGSINYVRYNGGDHRLFFTDINNTVVLDTTIKAQSKTFNGLYLTDEMTPADAPAKYKLVVVEEDRKSVAEKTGVRFIHLSSDAGNITCSLQNADGSLTVTTAGELAFGQASPYQFFGKDDVNSGGLVRFTLTNLANGVNFNTGIPFTPGRNYVILISGFRNDQRRTVAMGKNPDGSIKKEIVTINSNLRAEIRTSY